MAPGGRTTSRAMSNPLLSPIVPSCFVFTKHPVQLKTVMTCFQDKYVLFEKGHLNKRAGVWTPPGSATGMPERDLASKASRAVSTHVHVAGRQRVGSIIYTVREIPAARRRTDCRLALYRLQQPAAADRCPCPYMSDHCRAFHSHQSFTS